MARYVTISGNQKVLGTAASTSAGVADADKIVATGPDGFIDPSLLPDSERIVKEAGEGLSARDAVNIYDDGGVAKVRKADASSFSTRAMGFVKNNFLVTEDATVFSEGIVGGFAGLTIGAPVFLSTTSGEITQAPPTGAGDVWQIVGEAYSATEVRIEIEEAIVL